MARFGLQYSLHFFLFVYLFAYLFVYETTVNKQTKFTFLLQAILYEIDAWFRQLNQNITTDCSSDCTPFYTNMHILLWRQTICINSGCKFMYNRQISGFKLWKIMSISWIRACLVHKYLRGIETQETSSTLANKSSIQ